MYGSSDTNVQYIQRYLNRLDYNFAYFEHYADDDIYKNLWISSFKKRQIELNLKKEFDICLAIDTSDETLALFLEHENLLSTLTKYQDDKIYFMKGSFTGGASATGVSPQMFFSNSLTFDFACNFGIQHKILPIPRKQGSIDVDFYYFLKTLKIKTECIHFVNPNLFNIK